MAFKILNEDEIVLLTDTKKKQYERELDIYRKRVAFVEQLEKYENVVLEPYKPKLKPIAVIDKIEVREYQSHEYKAQIHVHVKKPEVFLNPIEIHKAADIHLPDVSVRTPEVKPVLFKKKQPSLPSVEKPVVASSKFTIPKAAQLDLPVFVKPEFAAAAFKLPEKSQIVLPLVEAPDVELLLSTRSNPFGEKKTPSNVPSITIANITVSPFVMVKNEAPVLPEVAFAAPMIKSFNKPEQKKAELPTFSKSDIPFKQMNIKEASVQQLPQVQSAYRSFKPYTKPEMDRLHIPSIVIKPLIPKEMRPIKVKVSEVTAPEIQVIPVKSFSRLKKELTGASKLIHLSAKSSSKLDTDRLNTPSSVIKPPIPKGTRPIKLARNSVSAPQLQVIPVKSFSRLEREFAGVPRQNKAVIPDAREALARFYSTSNSKSDITAGQVV